jgi:ribosome-associated protein
MFADYFVICSSSSTRQVQAIQEEILTKVRETGIHVLHAEGTPGSGWVVVDYGAVVVHIFLSEIRRHYNLEQLWKDAKTVVKIL